MKNPSMPQTTVQQADELSTLESSDVTTCSNTVAVPNDEPPLILERSAQVQALREEAQRLQKAGWGIAINENTMEVERWRPRGSFPCQEQGYLNKLGNLVTTYWELLSRKR
ncbi:MAG TPA: hypothetical protein V6D48_11695 [Oculatellaceae cyanobacterium]